MSARHPLVWTPPPEQAATILRRGPAPKLPRSRPIRVLTWNLQYLAGRGYVFFYDYWDWKGPDEVPSPLSVARTLDGVAAQLLAEDADILLLQELDDGSDRTGGADQLAALWDRLGDRYPVATEAFYWRSSYVPHPRVRGAVGLKLAIFSRWDLSRAWRTQLSLIPSSRIRQAFGIKRAVLEATLPVDGGGELAAICTHLDAFAHGTDAMERQVAEVTAILERNDREPRPWILGGDFNLLATAGAYQRLSQAQRAGFRPNTELEPLIAARASIPTAQDLDGPDRSRWHTYFGNDPEVEGPDRTIDYLFYAASLRPVRAGVRQSQTVLDLSDHCPVVADFTGF